MIDMLLADDFWGYVLPFISYVGKNSRTAWAENPIVYCTDHYKLGTL